MVRKKRNGFTLVELVIVIVILGILAAAAVPQFIDSTKDAEDSTLAGNLAVLRNAVNLYYHQHASEYPGARKTDGLGLDTVAADNPVAFQTQLTQYTDKTGKTNASLDRANYPLGPYLFTGIPQNPVNGLSTVVVIDQVAPMVAGDLDDATGWKFNKQTGELRANSAGYLAF